jgi:hypothetical protein
MKNAKRLAWDHFDKQMRAECAGSTWLNSTTHEYAAELKASVRAFKDTDPTIEQITAFTRVCIAMFNHAYS